MSALNRNTLETSGMRVEIRCPYCLMHTDAEPASNYEPIYVRCAVCSKRFILERIIDGFQALRIEGAPSSSDPDCREVEMGMGQEE
jgi:DNA-directed RNA polymerase subunit RPC12/RpoP